MIVVESLHHINVYSAELKKSVDFYTLFLDFELVEETEKDAQVRFDNLTLRIYKGAARTHATEEACLSFILDVDDFTDALQEIESQEIPIVQGPSEIAGGEKVLIKDPGGNIIELFYQE